MPHGLTSPSKPSAGRLCQSDNSISRKDKAMSQHDYLHSLPATGIDIPLEIRLYVIQLLQQTLLCTMDLHSHVKQACWNVKGTTALSYRRSLPAWPGPSTPTAICWLNASWCSAEWPGEQPA